MKEIAPSESGIHLSLPSGSNLHAIGWSSVFRDYVELTKPRIVLMIVLTTLVAMVIVPEATLSGRLLFFALVGTALVAASASVLNQWMERDLDSLMRRTCQRPLPQGRLTSLEVACFGILTLALGVALLLVGANVIATCIAFLTWALYLGAYTPMKTRSWWNTAIGTLPGALPVMIGWAAAEGAFSDSRVWFLFLVVVVWQFPHFMAIAWMYREEYGRAGFKMVTSMDPTGKLAGYHAVIGAAALIPLSLFVIQPQDLKSWVIGMGAVAICLVQLAASIRFFYAATDASARTLLRSSLLYLPGILILVLSRVWLD